MFLRGNWYDDGAGGFARPKNCCPRMAKQLSAGATFEIRVKMNHLLLHRSMHRLEAMATTLVPQRNVVSAIAIPV